MFKIR